ncbi:MAG TPA: sulfite exporter TauE/SafE family protein, partial [Eggerthellaceae bacterium]|nr:sulfite exporter TauE/SafE family protein [Eggerthellaceae bacterium]
MVATFFIMALAGIVVGVVSGMLGVGGGVIVIPMLRLGFGMPAVVSTATSLFTI